jgi:HK97 gp10 family phage protein
MSDIKTGHIQITGLSDLEKNLEQFSDRIAKNILRGAVSAGAAVIRNEARLKAPKDTGEMARDIMIKRARDSRGSGLITYHVFVRTGKKSRLAGKKRNVNRDSFYWRFVEFGTAKMSAKPFMRPAFDTAKERAVQAIKEYLAARIDKEAAKRG